MTQRLRLLFLAATLFLSARVSAQLMITNIGGTIPIFPNHADSISPYTVFITLFNSDSTATVIDTIDILYKADSNQVDTMVSSFGQADTITPMGSIIKSNQQFHFSSVNFDDGDNIVVIWPAARNTPGIGDSTIIHLYYDAHVGIDEPTQLPIKIYPNPATDYLYLGGVNQYKLKRVRIMDAIGKEIYNDIPASEMISIKNLKAGTYVISVESVDGRQRVIQFVKE